MNNLADNLQLFGLLPGSTNIFAATYTVFGDIVKSQYPKLVPSFDPVAQILDTSYVKELAAGGRRQSQADLPQFHRRAGQAASSAAVPGTSSSPPAAPSSRPRRWPQLKSLFNDLVVAGGTIVEIHGHTDNQGTADKNQRSREERAFAVKKWLEEQSPTNFPEGRIKVFAHGSTEPLDSNATAEGRAKNRRVEIVLGTGKES